MDVNQNLDYRLMQEPYKNFKSEGEGKIARFLEKNSIQYQYEAPVLVAPVDQKPRIWYPDFYLPRYKAYIEFYGLAERQSYKKGIELKNKTYTKMGLDVIPVYPWMLSGNWQGYLMRELKRKTYRPHNNLMAKPYWTGSKQHSRYNMNIGYSKRSRHRY